METNVHCNPKTVCANCASHFTDPKFVSQMFRPEGAHFSSSSGKDSCAIRNLLAVHSGYHDHDIIARARAGADGWKMSPIRDGSGMRTTKPGPYDFNIIGFYTRECIPNVRTQDECRAEVTVGVTGGKSVL